MRRPTKLTIGLTIAVALAGAATLFPSTAQAAGATKVCHNTAAVRGTVEPGMAIDVIFSSPGGFQFSGEYLQNGAFRTYSGFTSWWGQNSGENFVLVGATNVQAEPALTEGWMVETWQCS